MDMGDHQKKRVGLNFVIFLADADFKWSGWDTAGVGPDPVDICEV